MNRRSVEGRIADMFKRYARATSKQARNLVPSTLTTGKLYEAYVLGLVAERLSTQEGFDLVLTQGTHVALKSSPGPINAAYPRIEVRKGGSHKANIWTDVQFTSLSCTIQGRAAAPNLGDYHELDIIVADVSAGSRPLPEEIWLGVECKNTGYTKNLLREILGVRRELSLWKDPKPTRFTSWPRPSVPADPPSCLLVYSTDADVTRYSSPGDTFGINFYHVVL